MQVDKTTLNDLAIYSHEEEQSVLHHLDFTRTIGGREWLKLLLGKPLASIKEITNTQQLLQRIIAIQHQWPETISNGTVMVLEKFYDTPIDEIAQHANALNALTYKALHGPDYSLVKYSVSHFAEFVRGLHALETLLRSDDNPSTLKVLGERISMLLNRHELQEILATDKSHANTPAEILRWGFFFRRRFKEECFELIDIYSRLDAYYSMATACKTYQYIFPTFLNDDKSQFSAIGLWHPLLKMPVACDITLSPQENFLFLTGANMAGKSTFIKAAGLTAYLAHIGMGVPAKEVSLTYFDGLLSNIQVVDNIIQGESYFFNEVQRIRKTIEKISDGKKWLILIDELFKGTNVQDAMKCSSAVIEGLLKMKNVLFVLSTHLYEISDSLRVFPNIQFRYFETEVKQGQLLFSYQLKEGVSNDRIGYLILKREGVVEMLEKL
jgi:DNA mismatch repair ATPase MutS